MKISCASDLHLEFFKNGNYVTPEFMNEDVLVLAGDIQVGVENAQIQEWFVDLLEFRHVVYVLGNHEYYHQDYWSLRRNDILFWVARVNEQASLKGHNFKLYLLDDSSFVINDIEFIGGTVWTDFDKGNQLIMNSGKYKMNDFRLIRGFSVEKCLEVHYESVKKIKYLANNSDRKKVLVTHHLPSFKSVSKRFYGNDMNHFFYSDLDDLVELFDLAIHGHTHDSCDYHINNTRVVCNPFGYLRYEENPQFENSLIVEI